MDPNLDQQIVCADCGVTFVLTAAEAASYAERGLVSPKRCKECRAARKARGRGQGRGPEGDAAREPRQASRADDLAPTQGSDEDGDDAPMPTTSGNVNEYRSPMQSGVVGDSWRSGQAGQRPTAPRGRARGPGQSQGRPRGPRVDPSGAWSPAVAGAWSRDGVYRAPSFAREASGAARHTGGDPGAPRRRRGGPAPDGAGGREQGERKRAARSFDITCSACGAQAQVPFKPAEGREVFCADCYRARKPAAGGS